MEWDQIVRQITVSSNESSAYKLLDGNHNTCWQSSGLLGKVCMCVCVYVHACVCVQRDPVI